MPFYYLNVYWKSQATAFDMSIKHKIQGDRIVIESYPYKMSSGYTDPVIHLKQIDELLLDRSPPEIIRAGREVIFLDVSQRDQLVDWAKESDVRLSDRLDVWNLLTRPYLDMLFTPQEKTYIHDMLVSNDIKENEIEAIRKKIADSLLMYNVILRESHVLGHFDVLMSRKKYAMGGLSENYYWWSMKIALRNFRLKS